MGFPLRSEGDYICPITHGPETWKRKQERWLSLYRRESPHTRGNDKVTVGTSMVSPLQQLLLRHTS